MIIGNQKTGRWMKRSPFENPHVLADQLGNWLDGWKSVQDTPDYTTAPELRDLVRGEQLFRTRCAICHTVTGKELPGAVGPDLFGVTAAREKQWLYDWLKAPDQMLAKKDPIAMSLYEKYNKVAMPNMRLTQIEATDLLDYIESETKRIKKNEDKIFSRTRAQKDVVAVMDAWVREPIIESKNHAGYFSLLNVSSSPVTLAAIKTSSYRKVEIHEMTHVNGLMKMAEIDSLDIAPGEKITLEPGGKHLMLINPRKTIKAGGTVRLKLIFKSGKVQVIDIPISKK